MKSLSNIILILFIFISQVSAQEADAPHQPEILINNVDTSGWANITKNISYSEKETADWQYRSRNLPQLTLLKKLKYLILLIAVVIAGIFIFYVMRTQKKRSITAEKINWEEIEDLNEVEEKNIIKELEKALAASNFKLAVRLRFLILLKELVARDLIKWQKEKTNTDYKYELAGHPGASLFLQAANLFDFIWYGEQEANLQLYDKMKQLHIDLIQLIGQPQVT